LFLHFRERHSKRPTLPRRDLFSTPRRTRAERDSTESRWKKDTRRDEEHPPRMREDSNPRYVAVRRFSRPIPSTTQTLIHPMPSCVPLFFEDNKTRRQENPRLQRRRDETLVSLGDETKTSWSKNMRKNPRIFWRRDETLLSEREDETLSRAHRPRFPVFENPGKGIHHESLQTPRKDGL
jgi:hypothetical protein